MECKYKIEFAITFFGNKIPRKSYLLPFPLSVAELYKCSTHGYEKFAGNVCYHNRIEQIGLFPVETFDEKAVIGNKEQYCSDIN